MENAPNPGTIPPDGVDLWFLDLDAARSRRPELLAVLSEEEEMRAGRFFFERDRERFEVCRGLLRRILGHYTGLRPRDAQIALNASGKPRLEISRGTGIEFNVSHSGGRALIAVARQPVGVDLEECRLDFEWSDVAPHFCDRNELAALRRLEGSERAQLFFRLWTRKEAVVKAAGVGVGQPLAEFNVLEESGEVGLGGKRYGYREVMPAKGWMGAVALLGKNMPEYRLIPSDP